MTRSDLVLRTGSLEKPDVVLLLTIEWFILARSTQRVSRHKCQGQLFAMSERSKEKTYSDAEVEARLKKDLPDWKLESGWIRRKYKTNSWKGTLMVINGSVTWPRPRGIIPT